MDMEISDLSQAKAIPFYIVESDRFRKVITLARTVGPDYCPPNRNMIGGELLDINWKSYRTKTTKGLMDKADVFGIVFLGDLDTIKGCPLINITASSFNFLVAVLGVKYCSKQLVQGNFISKRFSNRPLEQYDEKKSHTDMVLFYGASNIQKAGQILAASYPRITVLHGAKHMLSLLFSNIEKFPVIRVRQR